MLVVRPGRVADAEALAAILNAIIARGGTTAHEVPFTPADLAGHYIDGPGVISCQVAEAGGQVLGFQSLGQHDGLPPGWADIATFTRQDGKVPGAGSALMGATLAAARAAGLDAINATIRADNAGGLAFYRKMGFVQYGISPAVPLGDGRPVDRLHHRREPG